MIEPVIDIVPEPKRGIWESCCFRVERQSTVYFGQLSFSYAVLAFCAIMLIRANGECNQSSPYVGIVSFLLGKMLSSVVDGTK